MSVIGIVLFASALCAQTAVPTPHDSVRPALRIFLIGDAGGALPNPVLTALTRELKRDSAPGYVLFLGDNVYPRGVPNASNRNRGDAEVRLRAQITAVSTAGAHAIFMPGNHDWGAIGAKDNAGLLRQADVINSANDNRIEMRPYSGCPGPDVIDVGPMARLVVLDTEWWLRRPDSRGVDSRCVSSESAVLDSLSKAIGQSPIARVIVLGHHPLQSVGPHGGQFSWRTHLFPISWQPASWIPLPVVGSIYVAVRKRFKKTQDLDSRRYTAFRSSIDSVFRLHRPLIYAAGHEHNLQVFRGGSAQLMLVSGGGGEPPRAVGDGNNLLFAATANGFMRLDLFDDQRARLTVLSVNDRAQTTERFSMQVGR